jgi:hypothetical protein
MNRKIVLLNLALLAAIAGLGWMLRKHWLEGEAEARAVMSRKVQPSAVMPPPAPAPVAAVSPSDYLEVATKTLYSSDRNPNVIVDPVKPPPPPPPMPALPVYYGQMTFGDPVVILTVAGAPQQKSYSVGQQVGDFKLVAFTRDTIKFDWNGKEVERKLDELAPKPGQQQQAAAPAGTPAYTPPTPTMAAPNPSAGSVTPIGGNPSSTPAEKDPLSGNDMGGGLKACVMGDSLPAGTVRDGWKKVMGGGLLGMGQSCHWEQQK